MVSSATGPINPTQQHGTIQRMRNQMFGRHGSTASNTSSKKQKKKHGWTASFVCLADNNTEKIPTAAEKEILRKCGLGLKRIFLEDTDSEEMVINKLMSEELDVESEETQGYTQLKTAGGIELMRTQQNSRKLSVIEGPYSSKELKLKVGCQAKIYIRPIQCSLSTKPIKTDVKKPEVKAECQNCHKSFYMCEIR